MTEAQAVYTRAAPKMAKKKKKCSICRAEFEKRNSMQKTCSIPCAIKQAFKDKEKIEQREKRKKLEATKTLKDYLKEAQIECNAYIRLRDKGEACISCGRYFRGKDQAGHYRSTGAAPQLRFNEDNIHSQCVSCNMHKSGSGIEYRINLIKKIGLERVEALENNNSPALFTIEKAKEIKKYYREKRKQLEKVCG